MKKDEVWERYDVVVDERMLTDPASITRYIDLKDSDAPKLFKETTV